jgi:glycine/D-amino acid oxidase-like deaminating enzyme
MADQSYDIVICGAGIAGVAAAWALAERGARVLLADERAPLSLTSDKSSECYRNFWPGPDDAMVRLMNRSIDMMEQLAAGSDNIFGMNRRGYLYATCDPARIPLLQAAAAETCALGAGELRTFATEGTENTAANARVSTSAAVPGAIQGVNAAVGTLLSSPVYRPARAYGYIAEPDGADLITAPALIRRHFPFLSERVVAVLHARRAGWLSAQQFGALLLERARGGGARFVPLAVHVVEKDGGAVSAVRLADGARVRTGCFVDAAGPLLRSVGSLLGVDVPVFSELHHKLAFEDRLGAVPRDAPMVIMADPLDLPWSDEERELLAESEETRLLLQTLPPGAHLRPEGHGASPWVLGLWGYHAVPVAERFPLPADAQFAEVVMRGLAQLVPALAPYVERPPRPVLDGGYYTRTRDNRPLVGPLEVSGGYVLGALAGYGIMAACACAELLAAHVTGGALPPYAAAFHPAREMVELQGETGAL